MRLIKTYLLRLYADTDVSERICGDVQPLDEKQSYSFPGFHVAKSVKLENLDKTPTLGEITGVLNQYYMNLQPK